MHCFQKRGELYLGLGQLDKAEAEYRKLLAVNQECKEHHHGLQKSLGLVPEAV